MFKVLILTSCKECSAPIDRTLNKRLRSFCSPKCLIVRSRRESNKKRVESGKCRDEQRVLSDKRHKDPKPGYIQCTICLHWYKRPLHHAWQRHGITEREYKLENGLALGRGIITDADRENMRAHTILNGTVQNLENGASKRFRKGDPRTKANSNPWGGVGAPRP